MKNRINEIKTFIGNLIKLFVGMTFMTLMVHLDGKSIVKLMQQKDINQVTKTSTEFLFPFGSESFITLDWRYLILLLIIGLIYRQTKFESELMDITKRINKHIKKKKV